MYLKQSASTYNYQAIATKFGDDVAKELMALEHQGTQVLVTAMVELGNILIKAKSIIPHGEFQRWCSEVWGISSQRGSEFMRIAESVQIEPQIKMIMPNKLGPATKMATAILKTDNNQRQELVKGLVNRTMGKGKPLTEYEIGQIEKENDPIKKYTVKQMLKPIKTTVDELEEQPIQLGITEVVELYPEIEKVERNIQAMFEGEKEVVTPVGRVDVLTNDEIIEIKEYSQWKTAVGQILSYGYFYPNHIKRVVLFGEPQEYLIEIIAIICTNNGIRLSLFNHDSTTEIG